MKNAFFTIAAVTALTAFFSFTSREPATRTEQYIQQTSSNAADTVPRKKDSMKSKSKTQPYDSFGKPKKMDSTARH